MNPSLCVRLMTARVYHHLHPSAQTREALRVIDEAQAWLERHYAALDDSSNPAASILLRPAPVGGGK